MRAGHVGLGDAILVELCATVPASCSLPLHRLSSFLLALSSCTHVFLTHLLSPATHLQCYISAYTSVHPLFCAFAHGASCLHHTRLPPLPRHHVFAHSNGEKIINSWRGSKTRTARISNREGSATAATFGIGENCGWPRCQAGEKTPTPVIISVSSENHAKKRHQ